MSDDNKLDAAFDDWDVTFDKFTRDIVQREEQARKLAEERAKREAQEKSWGLRRDQALREHPLQRMRVK